MIKDEFIRLYQISTDPVLSSGTGRSGRVKIYPPRRHMHRVIRKFARIIFHLQDSLLSCLLFELEIYKASELDRITQSWLQVEVTDKDVFKFTRIDKDQCEM